MDVLEREQLTSHQALGHWYYQAKFQLLLRRLKSVGCLRRNMRIADVGCGMGLFMTLLERSGCVQPEQLVGIEPRARARLGRRRGTRRHPAGLAR